MAIKADSAWKVHAGNDAGGFTAQHHSPSVVLFQVPRIPRSTHNRDGRAVLLRFMSPQLASLIADFCNKIGTTRTMPSRHRHT